MEYNPFYTDALVLRFQRTGESAVLLGLSYDFTPLGLPGIAAAVQYFRGWTSAPAAGLPVVEDEWDFNLEWRPSWKPLNGFWLRARYGKSDDQPGRRISPRSTRIQRGPELQGDELSTSALAIIHVSIFPVDPVDGQGKP